MQNLVEKTEINKLQFRKRREKLFFKTKGKEKIFRAVKWLGCLYYNQFNALKNI